MAKKIRVENYETEISSEESLKSKPKLKPKKNKIKLLLIVFLIILIVVNVALGFLYFKSTNKNGKLKEENNKILKLNEDLENENEEINSNLFNVIGLDSVYYVKNKLNFMDDNIVFKIEGFGNYYYTYDCMMQKVNGSYSYWAYNKEAAISNGLRAGGC
ncbi:MAG: hypothetical protein PHU94_04920 [Bacilli bacterium]|nr:hypothetical protein [Bacilli bacterium]